MNKKIFFKNSLYVLGFLILGFLAFDKVFGKLYADPDLVEQYGAAKALATGNGLNTYHINYDDLSHPITELLSKWPPGLSVITSIGFMISNDIQSIFIGYGVINILLFFVAVFILLRLLDPSIQRNVLFLVFAFLVLNPTYLPHGASTNLININLFLISSIALLKFHKSGKQVYLAIACILMVLTFYFRYAYLPALLIIPVYFLFRIFFYKSKEKKNFILSLLYSAFAALLFVGHVFYINSQTSYIQKTSGSGFKIYWENLKVIDPFPLHGFMDTQPILRAFGFTTERLIKMTNVPFYVDLVFYGISIFIVFIAIIYLRDILSKPNFGSPKNSFFTFGLLVSLSLIFIIYYGSVTNPSQEDSITWTWARVFRYFILPVFIIHVSFLFLILEKKYLFLQKLVGLFFVLFLFYYIISLSYLYSKGYKPYSYEANTSLFLQDSKFKSYQTYLSFPENNREILVLLTDSNINRSHFKLDLYALLNNYVLGLIEENPYEHLRTTTPIDIHILAHTKLDDDSPAAELVKKYSAIKYKTFKHDSSISLYKFTLEPNFE